MMICRAKVRQIIRFDDFSAKSFVTGYYGHEIEMYTVEQGEKRDKRQ